MTDRGWASTNAAADVLVALEKKGLVVNRGGSRGRTLTQFGKTVVRSHRRRARTRGAGDGATENQLIDSSDMLIGKIVRKLTDASVDQLEQVRDFLHGL
jgi:hypothetical protein